MKTLLRLLTVSLIVLATGSALADDEEGDRAALKRCFSSWGTTPFGAADQAEFGTIATSVKVLGIGKDIVDEAVTDKPKLMLVKPTVNVLTKNTYRLMNPNGWYCLKSAVTVLGKAEISLHCKAHLASSKEGVSIAGSSDNAGVAVLGKAEVKRVGCADKSN